MNRSLLFERLFRTTFVVMARVRTAFADKAYDTQSNRKLCRAEPHRFLAAQWTAACMIRSCVASLAVNSSTTRPPRNTRMRSDMLRISGR